MLAHPQKPSIGAAEHEPSGAHTPCWHALLAKLAQSPLLAEDAETVQPSPLGPEPGVASHEMEPH